MMAPEIPHQFAGRLALRRGEVAELEAEQAADDPLLRAVDKRVICVLCRGLEFAAAVRDLCAKYEAKQAEERVMTPTMEAKEYVRRVREKNSG